MAKPAYIKQDVEECGEKLNEIAYMMCTLHDIAAVSDGNLRPDSLVTVSLEFAKRSLSILDAVHLKLGQKDMCGRTKPEFEEKQVAQT